MGIRASYIAVYSHIDCPERLMMVQNRPGYCIYSAVAAHHKILLYCAGMVLLRQPPPISDALCLNTAVPAPFGRHFGFLYDAAGAWTREDYMRVRRHHRCITNVLLRLFRIALLLLLFSCAGWVHFPAIKGCSMAIFL